MRTNVLAVAVCAIAQAALLAAPAPEVAANGHLFPGGLADAAGKRAYVIGAAGGLEAIDLDTGKVVWSLKEKLVPLALAGDRLVVQSHAAGKKHNVLYVLDVTRDGKQIAESKPLEFPDWVAVPKEAMGRSFGAAGVIDGNDLYYRWSARAWYFGGAAPTPEVEAAARKSADGLVKVNLGTGAVEKAEKMPDLGPKVPEDVAKAAARTVWVRHSGTEQKNVRTAGNLALAVDHEAGRETKAVLKRWDLTTGKALEPVELLAAKALRTEYSGDNRFVLLHKAVAKTALPEGDYAWWVFATETGKPVAKLPYAEGTQDATVVGGKLIAVVQQTKGGGVRPPVGGGFTQARTLTAVELATGKKAWEHELEPMRFLPPPP